MIVVSNSTPLIALSKLHKLKILKDLYGRIYITELTRYEVVEEGIRLGREDAKRVAEACERWINVSEPKGNAEELSVRHRIHLGEAMCILLAKEIDSKLVLLDERDGRRAARVEGLEVKGTIGLIADAVRTGALKKEDALETLKMMKGSSGEFWLDPEVVDKAIERMDNL